MRSMELVQYSQNNHPPQHTFARFRLSRSVANFNFLSVAIPRDKEY
jgi:hypothetical protein